MSRFDAELAGVPLDVRSRWQFVTTCIALLRGINVGGAKALAMAELRALAAGLGYGNPRTLLQSGNLIFEATGRIGPALEHALEARIAERCSVETVVFVRTAAEWQAIAAANPFPDAARTDPNRLVAMFLREAPGPDRLAELRAAIPGPERVEAAGRTLYLVYPEGIGRSRLTGALVERKLGILGTARNWNTVRKLLDLVTG